MEENQFPLLPLPPTQPLLLEAPAPPSASLPPLPPRPSGALHSSLRAIRPPPISAIPSPVVNVVKNVFIDLGLLRKGFEGIKAVINKQQPKPPLRRAQLPRHVEATTRRLWERIVDEVDVAEILKAAGIIGGSVLLMYIIGHQAGAFRDEDEDEEALVAGRMPPAARRHLVFMMLGYPVRPPPRWPQLGQAGTGIYSALAITRGDVKEPENMDKAHKDSLKNSSVEETKSQSDPVDKSCMAVESELLTLAGKQEKASLSELEKTVSEKIAHDPVSVKRAAQLEECLRALHSSGDDKAAPQRETETIGDAKTMKQGQTSIGKPPSA